MAEKSEFFFLDVLMKNDAAHADMVDMSRFRRSPHESGPPGLSIARSCAVSGLKTITTFGPPLQTGRVRVS